jgi:hypothetical protein
MKYIMNFISNEASKKTAKQFIGVMNHVLFV